MHKILDSLHDYEIETDTGLCEHELPRCSNDIPKTASLTSHQKMLGIIAGRSDTYRYSGVNAAESSSNLFRPIEYEACMYSATSVWLLVSGALGASSYSTRRSCEQWQQVKYISSTLSTRYI